MKNRQDLSRDGGARWCVRSGRTVEEVFKSWGATDAHRFHYPDEVKGSSPVDRYMVKFDDGKWRYCHADLTVVYCSCRKTYESETGAEAAARYCVDHYSHIVAHRRNELATAEGHFDSSLRQLDALRGREGQPCPGTTSETIKP